MVSTELAMAFVGPRAFWKGSGCSLINELSEWWFAIAAELFDDALISTI